MQQEIRFDINPHVIRQLGEELVSDELTALLELVKNSYDADASYVSIEINTSGFCSEQELTYKDHEGYIIVEDDGFGMSEDTIIKSWLTISYSNKRQKGGLKHKTPGGRTPLGEKGLGRLSTQRLADICEIFTSIFNNKRMSHVAFDWREFERVETLSKVPVYVDYFTKETKYHGTKLILTNLHNIAAWQGGNVEKFKGQISQMISPYSKNRPFDVFLKINGQNIDLIKENEILKDIAVGQYKILFHKNTVTIRGKIKAEKLIGNKKEEYLQYISPDNGFKYRDYLLKNHKENTLIIPQEDNYLIAFEKKFDFNFDLSNMEYVEGEKANPGEFEGEINEFSYDNWMSNNENLKNVFNTLANYKAFTQTQAGIKLYRNGFAVKPFGLDGQDWLKLGDAQTKASSYYFMRPANVIGYIAIDEEKNREIKDKTDREGLISNPYSNNFFSIIYLFRDECNQFIELIRRSYNSFLSQYKIQNNKIKSITEAFSDLKETSSLTKEIRGNFDNVQKEMTIIEQKTNNYVIQSVNSPLFLSQDAQQLSPLLNEINSLLKKSKELLFGIDRILIRSERLTEVIDVVEPKISILEEQLENFSELASLGLISESVSHELSTISNNLAEKSLSFENKLDKEAYTEDDIYILLEYIASAVNGLNMQLKHIDPSLRYQREKRDVFDLNAFFENEEIPYYRNRLESKNIAIELINRNSFSVVVNKGKMMQIFDNLFNNSEYWLTERLLNEPNFQPRITITIDRPWVYFEDNGYGVSMAVKDSIFEPFVTTKPKGKGRGLGLFIIQQLLDSFKCFILLDERRNFFDRPYIFCVNLFNIIK